MCSGFQGLGCRAWPSPTSTDVAWDLEPLVDGEGAEGVERLLDEADERAARVAEAHAGRVAEIDGPDLAAAMSELQAIHDLVGRAGNYASLRFAVDTVDPANGALRRPRAGARHGDRDQAPVLRPRVGGARRRPGRRAARRRRAGHEPPLPAHPAPLPAASAHRARGEDRRREGADGPRRVDAALLRAHERDPRGAARRARAGHDSRSRSRACCRPTATCAPPPPRRSPPRSTPGLRTRAYIFNTLLQDKAVDDRLRNYPTWLASRNLANEASDESVQALVDAVKANYDLPRRWYRLKAQLLGLDRLADYDRMAAVGGEEVAGRLGRGDRARARRRSPTSRPTLGEAAQEFFDERYIDAPVRPGKRGGAFCAYTVPSRAPVPDAQLHLAPPRRAHARPRARPRPARGAGAPARPARAAHAAHAGRDRVGVRRDARVPAAARRRPDARLAPEPAGREHRGLDRHRVPPDGDEPLRGRRAHARAARRASCRSSASATCGRPRRPSCSATRSRSPRATARGGPTCRTSSARRATSTPTPTASCSRCPSTAATSRRARRSCPRYLELLEAGGSRSPEELAADRRAGPRRPGVLERRPRPRARPAGRGRETAAATMER